MTVLLLNFMLVLKFASFLDLNLHLCCLVSTINDDNGGGADDGYE